MLNPMLFRALQARFGEIQVTHKGIPMQATYEQGDEPGRVMLKVSQFGESYVVRCLLCDAQRPCLSINHRFGLYDPLTGSRNLHLATCFRKDCLAAPRNRERLADLALGLINRNLRHPRSLALTNTGSVAPVLDCNPAEITGEHSQE